MATKKVKKKAKKEAKKKAKKEVVAVTPEPEIRQVQRHPMRECDRRARLKANRKEVI